MPTIVRKGAVSKMGVAYAMPLSQMFDKVFDIKNTGVRPQCGKHSVNLRENQS